MSPQIEGNFHTGSGIISVGTCLMTICTQKCEQTQCGRSRGANDSVSLREPDVYLGVSADVVVMANVICKGSTTENMQATGSS